MLFLHIGMPKTGSSAIQAFLTLNKDKLMEKGVCFPNPPRFTQAFQTSSGNAVKLVNLLRDNELDAARNYLRSMDLSRNIVLSCEDFYNMLRRFPDRFFSVFGEFEYRVICYVRRQDVLFSSTYNQLVKNHNNTQRPVIKQLAKLCDFSSVLLGCLEYASADRFMIRPYERQQFAGGNIYSDFLSCIGLEPDDEWVCPEPVVNPSLCPEALEFRRIVNILEMDAGNMKAKFFINELLAKYTVSKGMGKPFQENNIFSYEERMQILNMYKDKNEQIAKIFLNREDGRLFYDPVPENDPGFQETELTFKDAVDICKYMLETQYGSNWEEELLKSLIKGTIDRLLDSQATAPPPGG